MSQYDPSWSKYSVTATLVNVSRGLSSRQKRQHQLLRLSIVFTFKWQRPLVAVGIIMGGSQVSAEGGGPWVDKTLDFNSGDCCLFHTCLPSTHQLSSVSSSLRGISLLPASNFHQFAAANRRRANTVS